MPVIRENSPCSDDSLIDDVLVNVIMDGTPSSSLNLIDVTYFSNMTINHILILWHNVQSVCLTTSVYGVGIICR